MTSPLAPLGWGAVGCPGRSAVSFRPSGEADTLSALLGIAKSDFFGNGLN